MLLSPERARKRDEADSIVLKEDACLHIGRCVPAKRRPCLRFSYHGCFCSFLCIILIFVDFVWTCALPSSPIGDVVLGLAADDGVLYGNGNGWTRCNWMRQSIVYRTAGFTIESGSDH